MNKKEVKGICRADVLTSGTAINEKEPVIWLNCFDEGQIEELRILPDDWFKDITFNKRQQEKIFKCLKNKNIDEHEVIEELLAIIKVSLEKQKSLISTRPLYNNDAWKRFEKELNNILRSLSRFSLYPLHMDSTGALLTLRVAFNAFNHTYDQSKEFSEAINKICDGVQSMVKLYSTVIKPEISKGGRPLKKTELKKLICILVKFYDKYSPEPCTIQTKEKLKINDPRRFFQFIDTCVKPIVQELGFEWIKNSTRKKSFHDEIKRILRVKVTHKK